MDLLFIQLIKKILLLTALIKQLGEKNAIANLRKIILLSSAFTEQIVF
ncbi:hypothetical protein CLU83_1895 [Flavobacterium sp. 1]|nr:hypothetical protein CLU83_1895 [Flavobacterium sp. 1]